MPTDLYYTTTEAARLLKVSDQTVRDMCARGEFPGAIRVTAKKQSQWRIPTHLPVFHPERQSEPVARPAVHPWVQKVLALKGKGDCLPAI